MADIINVNTKKQFDFLYKNWAMTWEGLAEESFEEALEECGGENAQGYLLNGKDMNAQYHLTGTNAYPDDLNIFAIYPFKGLAMMYGARWFTDIVDNNTRREKSRKK